MARQMEELVMDKMNIIYYTCNTHVPEIDDVCRKYLSNIALPIISVSLNKSIDFGTVRLTTQGQRSPLMMHEQIVMGLRASNATNVFLAESDVIYHPSHFEFVPQRDDAYFFNVNVWKVRWSDGFCVKTDNSQQVSGIAANRELLLDFYSKRVEEIKKNGFDRHYEPRNRPRINYQSAFPNLCIRHENNLTKSKWSVDDFRNKEYAAGWQEGYEVPGWDVQKILTDAKKRL